jgi:hypothetical protein
VQPHSAAEPPIPVVPAVTAPLITSTTISTEITSAITPNAMMDGTNGAMLLCPGPAGAGSTRGCERVPGGRLDLGAEGMRRRDGDVPHRPG